MSTPKTTSRQKSSNLQAFLPTPTDPGLAGVFFLSFNR
jgi:hypothetical protein